MLRPTFRPAVCGGEAACPSMAPEQADSCDHEAAPHEGAKAANHQRLLQQRQDPCLL